MNMRAIYPKQAFLVHSFRRTAKKKGENFPGIYICANSRPSLSVFRVYCVKSNDCCVAKRRSESIASRDEEHFVKVFTQGVKLSFDLSKAGHRVFQAVLEKYQREKMTGGYADSLSLFWFGKGLDGVELGMSKYTFNRGLKELLEKGFLFPRKPNEYWVNPALFFKGDRVAFLREYRLKEAATSAASVKVGKL